MAYGRIVNVMDREFGSRLLGDLASGATVIPVNDVFLFNEAEDDSGDPIGVLQIGDETYEYVSTDDDESTITLATATTEDYEDQDPVSIYPVTSEKYAIVELDGGGSTEILIPFLLWAWVEEANRGDLVGERVRLSWDGQEYAYENLLGVPKKLSGSVIDPDSTIPPEALTDGNPPPGSPTPVLLPFAVGSLSWMVDPVLNADPVGFKIYALAVPAGSPPPTVPIDDDHLVDTSTSRSGSFDQINGVTLLPEDPAVDADEVYVRCVEFDADGDADPSPESMPAIPRRAGTKEISVDWLYAGKIEVSQLIAGIIQAIILGLGDYIELDGPNSTITIFQDLAHTIPGVQLRSDGSVFRGRGEFDNLSVLAELIVRGTGHIATNASLILDNGVGDPMAEPTLTTTPEPLVWPAPPSGYSVRGICWDAANTRWLRLIRSSGAAKVEKINTSGVVTSTTTLAASSTAVNGITVIGSNWYTMTKSTFGTGVSHWRAERFNTSGALQATQNGSIPLYIDFPTVGTDGANLLVAAQTSTAVTVLVWDDINFNTLIGSFTWSGTFADPTLRYVGSGSFDFAGTRIVINAGNEVHTFTASGSALTEQTAEAFVLPSTSAGVAWDGANFHSTHGTAILYRYNDYYPGVGDTAYVAYTDTDTGSGNHTKASPIASAALVARRFLQVALPQEPSGATTPKVYAKIATSAPAVTALLLRAETITARNTLLDPATAGGAALGTDSNTFGAAGTPGYMASNSGGFEVHGDGDGSWPLLGSSDQKTLSASANPTSTTTIALTSLNMSVTVKSVNDVVWVSLSALVRIQAAATRNIIELLVDGVAETARINTQTSGTNEWITGAQRWRITGLAAGTHTLAFRTSNTAGSTNATVTSGHTVASFETTS